MAAVYIPAPSPLGTCDLLIWVGSCVKLVFSHQVLYLLDVQGMMLGVLILSALNSAYF